MIFGASSYRSSKIWNLLGRCEYLLRGHTTITATERFYNRRLALRILIPNSPESRDRGNDTYENIVVECTRF